MSAGLPGTGIAGVFYLASALLMPVIELERTLRGQSSIAAWRFVMRQFTLSCAILAGIWTTGWLLGLAAFTRTNVNSSIAVGAATTPQVVGQSAMVVSVVTLVVLVGGVEVMSLCRGRVAPRSTTSES